MKKLIFFFAFISINTFAQGKYITKTGNITFEASVPAFEEVKASNNSVTAILNADNGEFAALVFVKGFRFKNALMEEHFNENYAESDRYPKATFKGAVKDFSIEELKLIPDFKINGELTFHGVTKALELLPVIIEIDESTIFFSGNFKVLASDFSIEIPNVVKSKIAEDIEIKFSFSLKKKQ